MLWQIFFLDVLHSEICKEEPRGTCFAVRNSALLSISSLMLCHYKTYERNEIRTKTVPFFLLLDGPCGPEETRCSSSS